MRNQILVAAVLWSGVASAAPATRPRSKRPRHRQDDGRQLEPELQGVLKALRGANIDVVAIHQHMTGEQPRVMFLHY